MACRTGARTGQHRLMYLKSVFNSKRLWNRQIYILHHGNLILYFTIPMNFEYKTQLTARLCLDNEHYEEPIEGDNYKEDMSIQGAVLNPFLSSMNRNYMLLLEDKQ